MKTIENDGITVVNDLEKTVQQVFAEATRYPLEVLDPAAHLEDDLGIDSVKRAEIFIALQKKFGLPPDLKVPPEMLTRIRNITGAISSFLKDGADMQPSHQVRVKEVPIKQETMPAQRAVSRSEKTQNHLYPEDLEKAVISVFAEATRYPVEVLDPAAHLEDDLGIDSVKRAEIFIALQKKFGLPPDLKVPPEMLTSIRNIAKAIGSFGGNTLGDGVTPSSKPVHATVTSEPRPVGSASFQSNRKDAPRNNGQLIPAGHKPFTGKVALVTGSGHGIGKAIACRLAALGASIVVNSFHSRIRGDETVRHIQEEGGEAIHVWGSVAKPAHIDQVFNEINEHFGRLDFFVSNASNGIIGPVTDVTEEQWNRAFQTNVIGLHQGAIRARDLMKRHGGGKIITLSSPGAHRHIQHFGCMGPVKAAVESLTLYLAVEFAPDNIQVNCISVGPVYGELLSKYPDSDKLISYWESLSADNRLGEEGDVANFVSHLLSADLNKMTGSVLLLDNGGTRLI